MRRGRSRTGRRPACRIEVGWRLDPVQSVPSSRWALGFKPDEATFWRPSALGAISSASRRSPAEVGGPAAISSARARWIDWLRPGTQVRNCVSPDGPPSSSPMSTALPRRPVMVSNGAAILERKRQIIATNDQLWLRDERARRLPATDRLLLNSRRMRGPSRRYSAGAQWRSTASPLMATLPALAVRDEGATLAGR